MFTTAVPLMGRYGLPGMPRRLWLSAACPRLSADIRPASLCR